MFCIEYSPFLLIQMSEQIRELFQYTRLTEAGMRLKYMVACQLEDILSSSIMPSCSVAPFGSSVNGFGKHGCDTDIVIRPTSVEVLHLFFSLTLTLSDSNS